jgi:hypothetical protein
MAASEAMSGLKPYPAVSIGMGIGGGGTALACGGGGGASITGRTHPVGAGCPAVTAAAPHTAAAGALPLRTLSAAQGLICCGAALPAAAAVELISNALAANAPTNPLAMFGSLATAVLPAGRTNFSSILKFHSGQMK